MSSLSTDQTAAIGEGHDSDLGPPVHTEPSFIFPVYLTLLFMLLFFGHYVYFVISKRNHLSSEDEKKS